MDGLPNFAEDMGDIFGFPGFLDCLEPLGPEPMETDLPAFIAKMDAEEEAMDEDEDYLPVEPTAMHEDTSTRSPAKLWNLALPELTTSAPSLPARPATPPFCVQDIDLDDVLNFCGSGVPTLLSPMSPPTSPTPSPSPSPLLTTTPPPSPPPSSPPSPPPSPPPRALTFDGAPSATAAAAPVAPPMALAPVSAHAAPAAPPASGVIIITVPKGMTTFVVQAEDAGQAEVTVRRTRFSSVCSTDLPMTPESMAHDDSECDSEDSSPQSPLSPPAPPPPSPPSPTTTTPPPCPQPAAEASKLRRSGRAVGGRRQAARVGEPRRYSGVRKKTASAAPLSPPLIPAPRRARGATRPTTTTTSPPRIARVTPQPHAAPSAPAPRAALRSASPPAAPSTAAAPAAFAAPRPPPLTPPLSPPSNVASTAARPRTMRALSPSPPPSLPPATPVEQAAPARPVAGRRMVHPRFPRSGYCDLCKMSFSRLDKHMATTKHNNIKRYACTQCEWTFTQSEHLRRHMKAKHKVCEYDRVVPPCHFCGKVLSRKDKLREHILKQHADE